MIQQLTDVQMKAIETQWIGAIEKALNMQAINAQSEVVLEDRTRADLVTQKFAIEVEWPHKWAESIGQSLWYALNLVKKPAVMYLVNKADPGLDKYLLRSRKLAATLGIRVFEVQIGPTEGRLQYGSREIVIPVPGVIRSLSTDPVKTDLCGDFSELLRKKVAEMDKQAMLRTTGIPGNMADLIKLIDTRIDLHVALQTQAVLKEDMLHREAIAAAATPTEAKPAEAERLPTGVRLAASYEEFDDEFDD